MFVLFRKIWETDPLRFITVYDRKGFTIPTAEILSDKNAKAWGSIISYLKKNIYIKTFLF